MYIVLVVIVLEEQLEYAAVIGLGCVYVVDTLNVVFGSLYQFKFKFKFNQSLLPYAKAKAKLNSLVSSHPPIFISGQ